MQREIGAVIGVWLVACGGGSGPAPAPDSGPPVFDVDAQLRSGTRLKQRRHQYEGVRAPVAIFDQQRGERCSWLTLAETDPLRCLPTMTVMTRDAFGDPGCTQRLGYNAVPACRPENHFLLVEFGDADLFRSTIFQRVEGPAPTEYYTGTPGACAGPTAASGENQLSVLDSEIAPTEFAPAVFGDPEGGAGPMRARYLRSEDGAQLSPELYDDELRADCSLLIADDRSSAICRPVDSAASFDEYLDPGCTVRAVEASAASPPRYVDVYASDCSYSAGGTFLVGPRAPTQTLYNNVPGDCRAESPLPGNAVYTIGAAAGFRPLTLVPPPPGPRRLQRLRYTDGQTVVASGDFFDPLIDAPCNSIELYDGSIRCLPISGLTIEDRFSDDRCEVPIHVASVPTDACSGLPVPKFASRDTAPGCFNTRHRPQYELRRVIGIYPGTVYRGTGPGNCTALTGMTNYQLGEPVPLDQFATATLTTDP